MKVASEGASLTSELTLLQSLGPRDEKDFCPFDILKRGTRKSASVFRSLILEELSSVQIALTGIQQQDYWLTYTLWSQFRLE